MGLELRRDGAWELVVVAGTKNENTSCRLGRWCGWTKYSRGKYSTLFLHPIILMGLRSRILTVPMLPLEGSHKAHLHSH